MGRRPKTFGDASDTTVDATTDATTDDALIAEATAEVKAAEVKAKQDKIDWLVAKKKARRAAGIVENGVKVPE